MAYNRNSSDPVEQAILTTVVYSDIFNFPITKEELWRFLISKKSIKRESFENAFVTDSGSAGMTNKYITNKNGYYCLKGRESIIAKREKNLQEVAKKFQLAQKAAARLSIIPSITFIGVSGGLSVGNVTALDDIDLFVIVKKNTLFISRFWILTLLELMKMRRTPKMKHTADTICVNLLIDETALAWPREKQDLYTAREISQIVPLFERQGIYEAFLRHNHWIKQFLPNIFESQQQPLLIEKSSKIGMKLMTKVGFLLWFEYFMGLIQSAYMKRHRTTEIVTKHHLAFHPNDYRFKTLSQLNLKMRHLGLLTKF